MTDTQSKRGRVSLAEHRQRVEALGRTMDGEVQLAPEAVHALLAARARALAVPFESGARPRTLQLVAFELAGETYALETRFVFEVLRGAELVALPGAEPPVLAITGWRGSLLTVLDLRRMLGLPPVQVADGTPILVLGEGQPEFGIPVDSVRDIVELPTTDMRTLDRGAALQGITSDGVLVISGSDLIRHPT